MAQTLCFFLLLAKSWVSGQLKSYCVWLRELVFVRQMCATTVCCFQGHLARKEACLDFSNNIVQGLFKVKNTVKGLFRVKVK